MISICASSVCKQRDFYLLGSTSFSMQFNQSFKKKTQKWICTSVYVDLCFHVRRKMWMCWTLSKLIWLVWLSCRTAFNSCVNLAMAKSSYPHLSGHSLLCNSDTYEYTYQIYKRCHFCYEVTMNNCPVLALFSM